MENTEKKLGDIGTIEVKENVQTLQKLEGPEARILKDGFVRAICESASTSPIADQLKKKYELGEVEGYSVFYNPEKKGFATIHQFFNDRVASAQIIGKIVGRQFVGTVKEMKVTEKTIKPVEQVKVAVDWKEEPNLAITIKVKEKK
jgi:hypothetical protein